MNRSKLMLLGLGLVGRSLLNLLLKDGSISIDDVRVVDVDEEAFAYFGGLGGKRENFTRLNLDSRSYREIFSGLEKGDYLVRLADGCDDALIAGECLERGIHFISTSDDTFMDMPSTEAFRYRTRFYQYKELIKRSKGRATSILQFGMNPGLISILTKKALIDIVENDDGDYVAQNRERLRQLACAGNFPLLAKELQVTAFTESDLDTTQTDIEADENTVYSTWNVDDFYLGMNDRSIQKVGTLVSLEDHLKRLGVSLDRVYYYNRHDGTLALDIAGKDLTARACSGQGTFIGCVDAHEEVFSIHDYYTLRNSEEEIDYAPTVMFVYRPCDLAMNSVYRTDIDLYRTGGYRLEPITNDRMLSGTEAVGITVEGKNFSPVYVGVAPCYDKNSLETPSVLPVSASVYAAMRYISNHPDEGLLYPEYLDVNEILSYTERFLPVTSKKI